MEAWHVLRPRCLQMSTCQQSCLLAGLTRACFPLALGLCAPLSLWLLIFGDATWIDFGCCILKHQPTHLHPKGGPSRILFFFSVWPSVHDLPC